MWRYHSRVRCSFVVRAFVHGAMGRWIDPSRWTNWAISRSSQCSTTGGMCYHVCGMVHIKEPLLLIGKSSPCSGGSGFPLSLSEWFFTICPTPYNRTFKNVLSASLNKTFPSFLRITPIDGALIKRRKKLKIYYSRKISIVPAKSWFLV